MLSGLQSLPLLAQAAEALPHVDPWLETFFGLDQEKRIE